jgi:hypothetical protein
MIKKKNIWIFPLLITLICFFSIREFNSHYNRSINGDAKGYYAYLPALFIYQDPTYSFIDAMEIKYYPEDGSHYKNFKNKQKNGKYVNKCFPGVALFYLPFFLISLMFAWLFQIPIDGYSLPFQMGIGIAHLFYLFLGFYFLSLFLNKLNYSKIKTWAIFSLFIFGSNIWYYTIYDHTVSHIFNFFLACVFIWSIQQWIESKNKRWIGVITAILAIFIISRPTNALMILFLPFIFFICNENYLVFLKENIKLKYIIQYSPVLLILIIPPLLWKWQSDLWLVYSYNNEGFNFLSPNWNNFLFSYKKGWFLWSPLVFVVFNISLFFLFKQSLKLGFSFLIPFFIITYVLSSWWCWTYGSGMGQRAMIDFYPFIIIAILFMTKHNSFKINTFLFLSIPFIGLNILQSYQIQKSIYRGGETTSYNYWKYFLEWKTIPPSVIIKENWKLIEKKEQKGIQKTDKLNHFSQAIESDTLNHIRKIVVDVEIGAKHGDLNLNLIVSDEEGEYYKSFNFGDFIYTEPRKMSICFDVPNFNNKVYKTYIWNSDTESESVIKKMSVRYYTY